MNVPKSPPVPPSLPYELEIGAGVQRAKQLVRRAIARATGHLGPVIRVETAAAAVALTFDDGPDPARTPRLLDLLERHGARATFFMVGANALRHPELVARIAGGGHAVANHSWDHSSFRWLGAHQEREQLERCERALAPHGSRLFRPPFGELPLATLRRIERSGWLSVCWDVVAEDWRDHDAGWIGGRVLRRLRRGSIVLMHDTLEVAEEARYVDRAPLLEALDRLLGTTLRGYRSITVPELLRLGRPVRWPWLHRLPRDYHRRLLRPRIAAETAASSGAPRPSP